MLVARSGLLALGCALTLATATAHARDEVAPGGAADEVALGGAAIGAAIARPSSSPVPAALPVTPPAVATPRPLPSPGPPTPPAAPSSIPPTPPAAPSSIPPTPPAPSSIPLTSPAASSSTIADPAMSGSALARPLPLAAVVMPEGTSDAVGESHVTTRLGDGEDVVSADGASRLNLRARMQLRVSQFSEDPGSAPEVTEFQARRVRLLVQGHVMDQQLRELGGGEHQIRVQTQPYY